MSVLLLRLAGPMQSWGTRSRFENRDTERVPSKSGILGLVCAALGRPRTEPVQDLAELRLAVRVDLPGSLAVDYQTALQVARASKGTKDCQPSQRYYLADAQFLAALEGDSGLLGTINEALQAPRWPLFLGRKSFPPGRPVWVPDGLRQGTLLDAVGSHPWLPLEAPFQAPGRMTRRPPEYLEVELECEGEDGGEARRDQPIRFLWDQRQYGLRRVRRITVPVPGDGEE